MRKLFTALATLMYVTVAAFAAYGDPIEATPASGSNVTEIREITLKLTDKENYARLQCFSYTPDDVTVTKEGSTQNLSTVSVVSQTTYEEYLITLNSPITEDGTYTVTVPKSAYNLYDPNWSNRSYDIVLTYTIGGSAGGDLEPESVDPSQDQVLTPDNLWQLSVKFPNGTETASDDVRMNLSCEEAGYSCDSGQLYGWEGRFSPNFSETPSKDGVYTLTIEPGSFVLTENGETRTNGLLQYSWTLEVNEVTDLMPEITPAPQVNGEPEVAPKVKVSDLARIEFKLPADTQLIPGWFGTGTSASLTSNTDGVDYNQSAEFTADTANPGTFYLEFATPPTEPAEYQMFVNYDQFRTIETKGSREIKHSNPALTLFWDATEGTPQPGGSPVTADPADGSTLTEPLTSIDFQSSSDKTIYEVVDAGSIRVTKDGEDFCGVSVSDHYDGTYTMTLKTPATENGVYKVIVPEETMEYEPTGFESDYVPAFELTYTVAIPVSYKVIAEPASGSTLTEPLTSVTIKSGETDFPLIDILSRDEIKVTKDGEYFCGVTTQSTIDGMTLTLTETVTEGGEYVITLPADSWEMYTTANDDYDSRTFDLELTYTVDIPGVKYNIDILPGRVTPNSEDGAFDLDIYDGNCEQFYFRVDGALYLNPEADKASVVCKKNGYSVEAALTADEPKVNWGTTSTTFYLALDPGIMQDGVYTLSIPRGSFGDADFTADRNTGRANRAFTLDIEFTGGQPAPAATVVYDLDIVSTKPGIGVVDLGSYQWEVTNITLPADIKFREGATVSLTNTTGTYSKSGEVRWSYGNVFSFTNGTEPSENGTYVLNIPRGSFGDAEWIEDNTAGHSNPDITVYYRVTGASGSEPVYSIQLTSEPAADGTADIENAPLTIKLSAPGMLGFYPRATGTLRGVDNDYSATVTLVEAMVSDGVTIFTTTLSEPVTLNGEYTLNIPAGVIGDLDYLQNCVNGAGNIAYKATFTVTGGEQGQEIAEDLVPEVTPADKAEVMIGELDKIVFVFPAGTTSIMSARATLESAKVNYYDTTFFTPEEGADGTFYLEFFTKATRAGDYTMTIPTQTFFSADGLHTNPELTYNWTMKTSGIATVLTDEEAAGGVYTLSGIYVGDSLENLPAGVYVVKGRKIAVSK